jgi:hypothetical protein
MKSEIAKEMEDAYYKRLNEFGSAYKDSLQVFNNELICLKNFLSFKGNIELIQVPKDLSDFVKNEVKLFWTDKKALENIDLMTVELDLEHLVYDTEGHVDFGMPEADEDAISIKKILFYTKNIKNPIYVQGCVKNPDWVEDFDDCIIDNPDHNTLIKYFSALNIHINVMNYLTKSNLLKEIFDKEFDKPDYKLRIIK